MSQRCWLTICTLMLGTLFSAMADEPDTKAGSTKDVSKLPPRGFELPKITVRGSGDRYQLGSNVPLLCSISPAIATTIDTTVYHVKPNGDWMLMSEFHFPTDAQGKTAVTM